MRGKYSDALLGYGVSGRPDFAGFAAALRAEAHWVSTIRREDKTRQAALTQRTLKELADKVGRAGKELGYM
jgi:hypothetical protein